MTGTRYFVSISGLSCILLAYMYWDSLVFLFGYWVEREDYSHGILVPLISMFLMWQLRHRLVETPREQSWWGLVVIAVGLLLYIVGEFATLFVVLHLSLWIVIVGLVIVLIGTRGAKVIAFPLCYLLTAIPLPQFFYQGLSSRLQLWSSTLGVGCLQLVGVVAFQEGNVIDLGPVQLQVVEACSGIRYLLPLIALALLCAYLFKDRLWKRVILVLSSIPISILINGFRIGMIGVLVEFYGQGAAEGFYHLFEGWVLFMASLGMLVGEMWLLAQVGNVGPQRSFLERFTWIDHVQGRVETHQAVPMTTHSPVPAYLCSVALLAPVALMSTVLAERQEAPPPRITFVDFPMHLDKWSGATLALEKQYIDRLQFDDYVLADYRSDEQQPVNFYVAYYRSQKKGQSAHSPQSCLPGGGWEIQSLSSTAWPSSVIGKSLQANRVVIQKRDQKQVVLYWFKQRDRILTSEYLVKWYLLWDAIFRQRTDGALVRLASPVGPGESEAEVDKRLMAFASTIEPELLRFVPD